MAARPLNRPDSAPRTVAGTGPGSRRKRKPDIRIAVAATSTRAMASRAWAAESRVSASTPSGVAAAMPTASGTTLVQLDRVTAVRTSVRPMPRPSSITITTACAGASTRLSSGVAAMAKPKPVKPRSTPPRNTAEAIQARCANGTAVMRPPASYQIAWNDVVPGPFGDQAVVLEGADRAGEAECFARRRHLRSHFGPEALAVAGERAALGDALAGAGRIAVADGKVAADMV